MSLCACVIQVCRKYVNGSSGVIRVCTSVSGHRHRGGCVDTCRSVWYLHCVYTGREERVGHTARDSHCPKHRHGARCVCLPPSRAAGLEVDGNPSSPSCPQGSECWSMWAAAVTGRVGARRPAPASPGEHARQNPPLSPCVPARGLHPDARQPQRWPLPTETQVLPPARCVLLTRHSRPEPTWLLTRFQKQTRRPPKPANHSPSKA